MADRLGVPPEGPRLVVLMFHSFFETPRDLDRELVYPQEALTARGLTALVEHLRDAGYRFVHLAEVDDLEPGRYAAITFDDGYANNLGAVQVLREHDVPATIFVPTAYVGTGRRYWWDAVYMERRRRGVPLATIERELALLTSRSPSEIDAHLEEHFGQRAARALGELDRVVTEDELRRLAADPLLAIGNHTVDHVPLSHLDDTQVREQLQRSQEALAEMLGDAPSSVAYPEGAYDDRVLRIAEELGFRHGVTVERVAEQVPLAPSRRLRLGRFQVRGGTSLVRDLRAVRNRLQLEAAVARASQPRRRGRPARA